MLPSIGNLDPDLDREQKVAIIITCQISFRSYKQIQTVDQRVLARPFLFRIKQRIKDKVLKLYFFYSYFFEL